MKIIRFGIVATVLMCTISCKETPKSSAISTEEILSETGADSRQAYINKYNEYIAVWNNISPRVEEAYTRVTDLHDPATGKPKKKQDRYYVPAVNGDSYIDRLESMLKKEPAISELDGLGKKLVASYNALKGPLEKLSDYYKLQSYLEDDFETSSKLYPQVNEHLKEYLDASDQLGNALQKIDAKLFSEEMASYKEEGLDLLYARGMLLASIKQHTAPLYELPYYGYENIDFEAYDKSLAAVIEHYNAFKELSKDPKRLKAEMNISRPAPFVIFYSNLDTYIRESRNLKEMVKTPKDYNQMKSTVSSMGIQFASSSHAKVINAAESVITTSNSLN